MSNFFLRVPLQEKILFTKNMALALKSGVSLVNSLKLIQNQMKSRSMKKILESLLNDANRGVFLSDGLAKFNFVFGDLFVNVIRVAETSGTLPENLLYLGDELVKKSVLHKKVRGALVYPIVILIVSIIIAMGMILFVFPKILPLFQNVAELPFTTRMLIKFSDIVTAYGVWIAAGAIFLFVALRFSLRLAPVKYLYDNALFLVPIFGKSVINFNMVNFARTLGLLLRSGVKITEALDITGRAITNQVYRRHIRKITDNVRKGEFISKYLGEHKKLFPTILTNMIEVGENTGNLTDNLNYLAEYYENEVDDFVKNLSSIVEPILLLFMGVIVGFIALSFITPIYELTKQFR